MKNTHMQPKSKIAKKFAKANGIPVKKIKPSKMDPYKELVKAEQLELGLKEEIVKAMKVTWSSWIHWMEENYGNTEGWDKLRGVLMVPLGDTVLVWRGHKARELEQLVRLYDSGALAPVGKAYWQEPLLTLIAGGQA